MTINLYANMISAAGSKTFSQLLESAVEGSAHSCYDRVNRIGYGIYTTATSRRLVKYIYSTSTLVNIDVSSDWLFGLTSIGISYDGTKLILGGLETNAPPYNSIIEYNTSDLTQTGKKIAFSQDHKRILPADSSDNYYVITGTNSLGSFNINSESLNYQISTFIDFCVSNGSGVIYAITSSKLYSIVDNGSSFGVATELATFSVSNAIECYFEYKTKRIVVLRNTGSTGDIDLYSESGSLIDSYSIDSLIDASTSPSTLETTDSTIYFCTTFDGGRKTYSAAIASGIIQDPAIFSTANMFTGGNDWTSTALQNMRRV